VASCLDMRAARPYSVEGSTTAMKLWILADHARGHNLNQNDAFSMRASSCPPGMYGPDGVPCMSCPSGSYKALDGRQSPCTPCPPNTGSLPGSTNVSACQCMQDHTEAPDGTCTPCPPGTYKNGLGAGQCSYSELALQETKL
jgi:hypothetical protein